MDLKNSLDTLYQFSNPFSLWCMSHSVPVTHTTPKASPSQPDYHIHVDVGKSVWGCALQNSKLRNAFRTVIVILK